MVSLEDDNLTYIFLHFFRSSVGNKFAKNRAIIFAAIGILFLTAGVGVTVIDPKFAAIDFFFNSS